MSDFKDTLLRGVSAGLNNFKNPLENKNQAGSNFLKAFLGTGALQFNDDSGSVSIDPRTGAFTASPKNRDGIGFTFNPLMQSASIKKGPFELSGGLRDAPINSSPGYGPTNEEMFRKFSSNEKTPWGMIGFRFGGNNPAVSSLPEDDSQPAPRINLYSQPPERKFANQSVKELLDRSTGSLNSERDPYNPSTW